MRSRPKAQVPLAAVIGYPTGHSLSPLIFSFLSKKEKRPIDYQRVDVSPAGLALFTDLSRKLAVFLGWNVTIPHKQKIARLCDALSEEARVSGAVNVVRFAKGRMLGYNTDILGVERALEAHRFRIRGSRAVIFGAGGAALAAACALANGGAAEICFVNRTHSRARSAALRLRRAWPAKRGAGPTVFRAMGSKAFRTGSGIDLYINATPIGMKSGRAARPPQYDPFPADARVGALAFDLVYVPERTPFLRSAERRGLRAVGGLDMLIWQALATWEIWFGRLGSGRSRALKTALERELRAELRKRDKRP